MYVSIAEVLSRPALVITIQKHLTFKTRSVKLLEEAGRVMRLDTEVWFFEQMKRSEKHVGSWMKEIEISRAVYTLGVTIIRLYFSFLVSISEWEFEGEFR
jgi:hypothetical protein